MSYYQCRECLQIFDKLKPKLRGPQLTYANILGVCPNCESLYFDSVFVNELNIIIFDDEMDCEKLTANGKSLPCKYDVKFTDLNQYNISRTPGMHDYRMMFKVNDFIIMDSFELARYIMQFIIDTSKDRKHICLKYTDQTVNLVNNRYDAQKLFEQQYLLQQNLQRCQNFIR